MTTYRVIQDIEAEDKLVGPLTLRQFIYGLIAALCGYLGFLTATKGAPYMLVVFAPIMFVCGFFAFPFRQDQPTEVWALAKIRFIVKPRRRMWDQSGAKELVTVTAPRGIVRPRTDGLRQDEVHSRLSALANTLDSRGWAIKNVNVNLSTPTETSPSGDTSDRLVEASSLPQSVSAIDVKASDDILDGSANPIAHQFESMITTAGTAHHQQLMAQMQQPSLPEPVPTSQAPQAQERQQSPADYWFMQNQTPTVNQPGQVMFADDPVTTPGVDTTGPLAAASTPDEEALVEKLKAENEHSRITAAYGHLKILKTPEQLAAEARKAVAAATAKPPVTPTDQAAIINLANNDDLNVATIARQAHEQVSRDDDGEVIISLR